jgi:predicted dehydrogenase
MIDAAIVGLGRWGKTLVEAVQGKSEGLRFARAVSRNPDQHRDFAAQHRLELVDGIESVLADPSIDAVVLATPHSLHCEQIIAVAAARKAVFCEKPLTLRKAEAARAIEACRAAGVVLGVGTDNGFFRPCTSWCDWSKAANSARSSMSRHISAMRSPEPSRDGAIHWRNRRPEG